MVSYVLYKGDDLVGVFGSYSEIAKSLGVSIVKAFSYATDEQRNMVHRRRKGWKSLYMVLREEQEW